MEDRETPRMRKYGESKTTRIMMATVPRVTSGSGLRKFQTDGFLLDRVYIGLMQNICYSFRILTKLESSSTNIRLPENPSSVSRVIPCGQMDGQT